MFPVCIKCNIGLSGVNHFKKSSSCNSNESSTRSFLMFLAVEKWSVGSSIKYVRKIFQKANIPNPLIRKRTCAYQGVRNVIFSENFAYVLNG